MKLRVVDNPPNPYLSQHAQWLEPPPLARLEVLEDASASILSRNDSPDIPFTWSVNPYRGCQHACAYCYARRTHEYLGFGAGTDFDTRIVVKPRAPELLRAAFGAKKWQREGVNFSGVTDCYQPLEASYGLTRRCLEVCVEFRNPVVVVTKAFLVVRDADVLAELHRVAGARVLMSVPFLDAATADWIEPQAPPPPRRFEAIRRLSAAGIPVGVLVAPIIPGLNDRDMPRILEQAAAAGAQSAGFTGLRLPGSVAEVFLQRLEQAAPLRAGKVTKLLRNMHGGHLTDSRFGERMRGQGPYWKSIRDLFDLTCRRVGLERHTC
ncbi:MAG: PA0069 family radical SAM protein [Planctomycetes bacterium]|nr:PA0069 family radical SAM protein [Planctomycetota bacterium]